MEEHLKNRPDKKIFSGGVVDSLRNSAIEEIKSRFLPDDKIIKIILIGSSVKENSFGEYEPPGFRGSLYSDFDFIIFVEDNYIIPDWLEKGPTGKPFPEDVLNLAFRNKRMIDKKYDIEVFFIRRKSMENPEIQKLGELAGIPMAAESKHKKVVIYSK
jgi:hypothetical protein